VHARRALAVIVLLGVAVLGSGCGDSGAWALRFAGRTVSYAELEDELDEIAGNEAFQPFVVASGVAPGGSANGSYSQAFVAAVISNRLFFDIVAIEAERRDIEVTEEHREGASSFFEGVDPSSGVELTADRVLGAFSDEYRARIEDDLARLVAFQQGFTSQEEFNAWLRAAFDAADIEVSPRYGRWDPAAAQVIPPDGPRTPPLGPEDQRSGLDPAGDAEPAP
jgi:hypothetical protein